jgi:hypothetical protein
MSRITVIAKNMPEATIPFGHLPLGAAFIAEGVAGFSIKTSPSAAIVYSGLGDEFTINPNAIAYHHPVTEIDIEYLVNATVL